MKKIIYFACIFLVIVMGCNPKIDYSQFVPGHVNKFATGFISEVHKGNIDTCLSLLLPEINNENGRQFLTNTYRNIQAYSIDSFSIVGAQKSSVLGNDGFTTYQIEYEYKTGSQFLYFVFGIKERNGKLAISAFDGQIMDNSVSTVTTFSLSNKEFVHYLFLGFAILMPIFMIISLIVAVRTKLKTKWLWIIGILLGFGKLSINWASGQIGFSIISFSILGSGFYKAGNSAPWILSLSLPIVAIAFWLKRYQDKKAVKQIQPEEHSKEPENTELN